MIQSQTKLRVRYVETDQMGYLYHGHYAQYYEVGRVEFMRELGLTYQELEANHGFMMPVMSLQSRFVRPAKYDELLTIETTLRQLPERTITFHMELKNEQGQLINGGRVKLCFINAQTKQSVKVPEVLLKILESNFKS